METLSMFLASNAKKIQPVEFVASDRFVHEGKPVAWKIGCITAKQNARLRDKSVIQVPVVGKKGQYTQKFDTATYLALVTVACTLYPNLNDVELQNSYGVMSAEDLITTMLTPGEFDEYSSKVLDINGFNDDKSELVEKAKN